jgi:hypothetical protein
MEKIIYDLKNDLTRVNLLKAVVELSREYFFIRPINNNSFASKFLKNYKQLFGEEIQYKKFDKEFNSIDSIEELLKESFIYSDDPLQYIKENAIAIPKSNVKQYLESLKVASMLSEIDFPKKLNNQLNVFTAKTLNNIKKSLLNEMNKVKHINNVHFFTITSDQKMIGTSFRFIIGESGRHEFLDSLPNDHESVILSKKVLSDFFNLVAKKDPEIELVKEIKSRYEMEHNSDITIFTVVEHTYNRVKKSKSLMDYFDCFSVRMVFNQEDIATFVIENMERA